VSNLSLNVLFDPWSSGVLDPEQHDRLVAGIDKFCVDARITRYDLARSAKEDLSHNEIEWIKNFPFHAASNTFGLVYVGRHKPAAGTRMIALTACLLRNYTRARIFPMGELLTCLTEGAEVLATCLLIPDFISESAEHRAIPDWKRGLVSALLWQRRCAGQQTVIEISSWEALAVECGQGLADRLQADFISIET
jgi:hypothetical protein